MKVKTIFNNMDYGYAPESSSAADEWLDAHKRKFTLYIDGKWQAPLSKKYFESVNPATTKNLALISQANEKDVDKAVKAAKKALPKWIKIGAHARARYLYAIARQIQKHSRLFSVLESMDNGKPIRESRDIDIPLAARHFYHHAGWAQLRDTELQDYKEVGVIAQIIPWNFPLLMLAWKIAPALAMGNTVVLKPAEFTSITALLFAEICEQIGLPDGVVNIITGDGKSGAAMVDHPDVDKIAFTGSTDVGRIIRRATAGTGKKISLELGGKSPFIVFDDADLDSVVEGVVDAIWFNQGQVCCAGSRLLVQESVAEKLYAKIKARMEKLRVGNSLDKSVDIGAIIAPVQLRTIEQLVAKGIEEGGQMWQPSWSCPTDGYFYPPTLFTDVSPSSTIAQLEIFGPVLVAMTFRTHPEAIKLANNTRYGLASSIWTENINLALDMAPKIKAGTVWINCTNLFDAASGFGGYRESGFGREGGREGLYEYLKLKSDELQIAPKKLIQKKNAKESPSSLVPEIDRTIKLFIGGKEARPDGGYSSSIKNASGKIIATVSQGNRKDIRNAVEAAHAAESWTAMTGHARAQILYYLAENLAIRKDEFAGRLIQLLGVSKSDADREVSLSIDRIYTNAAKADKYDGHVHHTLSRHVTMAMPEALGVMGIVCPDTAPLLGFISAVIPALAMGNRVIVIPSETTPLSATDMFQVFEASDFPGGVINIITGKQDELAGVLANHDDVDGLWYFGTKEGSKMVEHAAAENMKRTWVNFGKQRDWYEGHQGEVEQFLRNATQIKNIWIPYGE
ncbi:MAG: aldehyde dehydrogenase family protein [Saprospiraceae bacterium]|uniref:Aldehyde dehydrogenase family protein n=1 Tax=Candidatus Opimibacter skivensis TaxID=2982028 RepID=A0A9D7XQ73_9BACT|nr:aldehyde dehydrogenase family protein [Candidatus Opimibacter skivensis]